MKIEGFKKRDWIILAILFIVCTLVFLDLKSYYPDFTPAKDRPQMTYRDGEYKTLYSKSDEYGNFIMAFTSKDDLNRSYLVAKDDDVAIVVTDQGSIYWFAYDESENAWHQDGIIWEEESAGPYIVVPEK